MLLQHSVHVDDDAEFIIRIIGMVAPLTAVQPIVADVVVIDGKRLILKVVQEPEPAVIVKLVLEISKKYCLPLLFLFWLL